MRHVRGRAVSLSVTFLLRSNPSFQSPTCSFLLDVPFLSHSTEPITSPVCYHLPGMRDFASRSARLRDKVLLRDLFAFCGPLDHGSYVKLREVTLKTSRLSRSRCLSSLLLTHDRQIAGCQAEDVIRKAGGAQGQAGPPDSKRLPRGLIGEFPPLVPLLLP